MALGRDYTKVVNTELDIEKAFDVILNVLSETTKIIVKKKSIINGSIQISGSEKVNWLSTNWPSSVQITSEIFDNNVFIKVTVYSEGTSITQSANSQNLLDRIIENLRQYL